MRPSVRSAFAAGTGWAGLALCFAFLYAPLLITVVFSFNDSEIQALPLSGVTLDWYRDLFGDSVIFDALLRSLAIAAVAVTVALLAGTGMALLFARMRSRSAAPLQAVLAIPALLPGIVLGLSLAIAFREVGISPGFVSVVIGHAAFLMPIMLFMVLMRLRRLDPSLEQASMDLGAGPGRTFLHITLPQLRSALVAAFVIGATLSMDEILVTSFLAGTDPTLPVYVRNQLRFGFTPEINAIFTCVGVLSALSVVLAARVLDLGIPGLRSDRA